MGARALGTGPRPGTRTNLPGRVFFMKFQEFGLRLGAPRPPGTTRVHKGQTFKPFRGQCKPPAGAFKEIQHSCEGSQKSPTNMSPHHLSRGHQTSYWPPRQDPQQQLRFPGLSTHLFRILVGFLTSLIVMMLLGTF